MADRYSRDYLRAGEALHAQRTPLRTFFNTLRALAVGLAVGGVAVAGATMVGRLDSPGAAFALLLASLGCLALGVMFGVVRAVVTASDVTLAVGLVELRIPMGAIVDVAIAEPTALRRQAVKAHGEDFGASLSPGPAVRVTWLDDGRERDSWIASQDPSGLVDAIRRARAGKVRVAVDSSTSEADLEGELAEEAAADEERVTMTK